MYIHIYLVSQVDPDAHDVDSDDELIWRGDLPLKKKCYINVLEKSKTVDRSGLLVYLLKYTILIFNIF